MDSTRFQRPRYVHKRAGSGNETATLDALQASTSVSIDTQNVVTTHSSAESTATLPVTTSSQTTIKGGSPTSNATPTSSAESTIPTTSSVIVEKTPTTTPLPTSITSSDGSSLTSVVTPTSLVIPDAAPTSKPASSSVRQLVQAPPNAATQPAPPVPVTTEAPNQPAPPVPATTSTSTPASVPAPISTSVPPSVSTSTSASSQLPSSISPDISATTGTGLSSLLLDTSMQTASMSSIPVPSFVSMSTTLSDVTSSSALPSVSKAFQLQSSASASTSLAPAPVGASTNSPQTSAPVNSTPQGSNMTTIVGAAVGSVAGFVLLALLGIWCIRRRYRNTTVIMSPFTRRHSARDRVPLSPVSMNEGFRPDAKTLFSKESYSTFDEKESTPSSRSYTPPNRHSRSYTTNSLPPVIPARSVARPLSTVQQPPAPLKSATAPALPYKAAEPIDTSFMGTISTYFSSTPTITEEPFNFSTNTPITSNKTTSSSTSSIYTQNTASPAVLSPHASFLPPITPNLPPPTTTTTQTPTTPSPPPPSISPPIPPIPSPPRVSTSPLASSHYQSMGMGMGAGAWRDSMWSTSATPIAPAHLPPGTATSTYNYNFFDASRPASTQHRASRSLGDVLDWKMDFGNANTITTTTGNAAMAGSEKIGTAQSLYSPPLPSSSPISPPLAAALKPPPLVVVPVPEGPLAIPPRSPLRSWPLRGN